MARQLQNLTIKVIIIAAIAAGYMMLCTGCYTKKQAIEKFCRQDTISMEVTIFDTVETETIKVDTFFKASIDSFTVLKDKLLIKYILKNDTIYLSGKCIGDTIFIEKQVPINVAANCPQEKLTYLEWFDRQGFFVQAFHVVIGLFALLFAGTIITSWFNSWRSQ